MMAYQIDRHFLLANGRRVRFVQTPNGGKLLKPRLLILHYTAGRNFESSVSWFKNPQAKASAHLILGRAGEICQMQPFNKICWHAGVSKWKNLRGLNNHAIGIEIDNAGILEKSEKGIWHAWFGKTYPSKEVLVAKHRLGGEAHGWHIYPQKQIELVQDIAAALHAHYQFDDILGHDDISWPRKTDPGPAFPLQSLKAKVLGRA
jgi:N-acetylmuramoyl-L-alanine amidase